MKVEFLVLGSQAPNLLVFPNSQKFPAMSPLFSQVRIKTALWRMKQKVM